MGVDLAKLKEKFEKKSAERTDRLNLKDKDNELRLLPPSIEYLGDSVDYIAFEYLMHFNLGIEGAKTAEVCPKTAGKTHKCPICDAVYKLYKTNTAEDKALAGELRAKRRYIFNAVDVNNLEKGIQVLEVGPKIYEALVVFVTNPKWGDLLDIDKGRNITITKTPAKETTTGYVEYSVAPDPEVTSIRSKLPKEWKAQIDLLKKQIPGFKTYDELKAILEGEESVESTTTTEHTEKEQPKTETHVEKEEVKKEEKKEEKKKPDVKPDCFGEDYGPRKDECLACTYKVECRQKFLEV